MVFQMNDLTHLSSELDEKHGTCKAIIETPKGCRNKFDYDPDSNLFMLGGLLPEGMMFPFDFGFIPGTLGEDGDPVDVMVLMDAPAHVGCLIQIRIIGVIRASQAKGGKTVENDRLLGVAVHSYNHENVTTINDIGRTLLAQIEAFFVSYNEQRGKQFRITGTGGPQKALRLLRNGIKAFEKKTKSAKRGKRSESSISQQ